MLSNEREQITESNNSFKCYNAKEADKVGFYTHDEKNYYMNVNVNLMIRLKE